MRLGKRIFDREKSEIVDLYLRGLTRDEIAKKTGVSAGAVSGVIAEFTNCADSTSTEEAAEEYDVAEPVESLRSLAVEIRKAGTTVEVLMRVSKMLERIKKLIELDRLEEFIRAGESLKDKAHVESAVRMYSIEERAGKTHDDILSDLESKEVRVKELSSEVQRLNSEIRNLTSERKNAQKDLNAEKTKLEAELGERLKQHTLTLEKVEYISNIEKALSVYGIKLAQLEGLQRVLNAVEEAGQDAKRLVQVAKNVESLRATAEAEAKELTETREMTAKLSEAVATLEQRLMEAEVLVERSREIESIGWNRESLEKAIKVARDAGSPEEVLDRIELLKPSVELKTELDRVKNEVAEIGLNKKRLQKSYESLRQKYKDLEEVTEALKELFTKGFNREILLLIRNEASKYKSLPMFMEAFGRYKHKEEVESEIKEKEEKLKTVNGELEEKTGRLKEAEANLEAVALKAGGLKTEIEMREKMLPGLKVIFALTNEPRSLTIDSITWLTDRILIWAKNKQEEVKKKGGGSQLNVGSYAEWLCESLRKLKEGGY